jgi:hypothetical protein
VTTDGTGVDPGFSSRNWLRRQPRPCLVKLVSWIDTPGGFGQRNPRQAGEIIFSHQAASGRKGAADRPIASVSNR